ncbi:hypothetical protein HBI10_029650 [Parastagonospora nodorum]|nr:hypothetical protein HBI10_029650 [Parastagonospora nodorum]KAH6231933.1 hypothetical protein HBI53_031240 [Parastagonospora nodorum]
MLFLTSYAIEKMHIYAADSLSSTITVYNYIKKDKNADLTHNRQLAEELATAESITAKELLIARGNISNAAIQTILFAFIINYILETSSRTYNKAY